MYPEWTPKLPRSKEQNFGENPKSWLTANAEKQVPLYSPTGAMGKALSYLFTYREYLTTYLDIVEATPDNNAAERIAKPFAVSRKNWLFAQTIDGADATAFFFSLIETAKLQNISPSDYVEYVLTFGPSLKTKEEFKSLLPWNVDFTRLEKIRSKRFNATADKTRTKPYIFAGSNR